jgi:hypothetical protein
VELALNWHAGTSQEDPVRRLAVGSLKKTLRQWDKWDKRQLLCFQQQFCPSLSHAGTKTKRFGETKLGEAAI